jgi:DNA mismatch endonuclease (patch repair protein)
MQTVGSRDTEPEKLLRGTLFKLGLRFRKDYRPIPGLKIKADIVFTKHKVCLFIDGCFWHGCPLHFKIPKTNSSWWNEKIEDNKTRDLKQTLILTSSDWTVIRLWEHEIKKSNILKICEIILKKIQPKT